MPRETSGRAVMLAFLLCVSSAAGVVCAQSGSGAAPAPNGPPPYAEPYGPADRMGPPPMEWRRPPMERAFHLGPPGRWWNNPEFASELGLTPDQQKKMEAVFEENRPKLIDQFAKVRKEEATLQPMLGADQPDEAKILAQVDHVAQARANLEKANARMLLGLRRILTQDQWKKLEADDPGRHSHYGSFPPPPMDAGPDPH